MDDGIERIRQLSVQARQVDGNGRRGNAADATWLTENKTTLESLEVAIPNRLRQLAEAADGDLTYEASAFRSSAARAMRIFWRPGTRDSHDVELWLLRDTGSVEWRWTMGHREPNMVHRVPATRFNLTRLDDLVAALAEPDRWRDGHAPEI